LLATASFSQAWLSGGLDLGVVWVAERDPSRDVDERGIVPTIMRARFGGGLHLRAGTRRWGFTINLLGPSLEAELVFDVRFGAFEMRPRGGWRPAGVVWATDRRTP
jgi:hypothetical protein